MDKKIQTLLDAHVAHQLSRFQGEALNALVAQHVSRWLDWISEQPFEEMVSIEQVLEGMERYVVNTEISAGVIELAGEMSRAVLTAPINQETDLKDIFTRKEWRTIIEFSINLNNSGIVSSLQKKLDESAYTNLISGILYHGIKEFLLSRNALLKEIPALSSLVKKGQDAVNKAFPKLEASVEGRVREFIEDNLARLVKGSEEFIREYLDEDRIREQGEEIFNVVFTKKLAQHFSTIDTENMEDFIVFGYDFWQHFRQTNYFKSIYTDIIQRLFDKYGDRPLGEMFEDFGVTQSLLIREIQWWLPMLVNQALESGVLEQSIREELESFYGSTTFADWWKGQD